MFSLLLPLIRRQLRRFLWSELTPVRTQELVTFDFFIKNWAQACSRKRCRKTDTSTSKLLQELDLLELALPMEQHHIVMIFRNLRQYQYKVMEPHRAEAGMKRLCYKIRIWTPSKMSSCWVMLQIIIGLLIMMMDHRRIHWLIHKWQIWILLLITFLMTHLICIWWLSLNDNLKKTLIQLQHSERRM